MLQRTYSSTPPNNCNNGIVNEPGTTPVLSYKQVERHMYGSSRIGLDVVEKEMIGAVAPGSTEFERVLGYKQFEVSEHRGNVMAVVLDSKAPRDDNQDLTVDYYQPVVITATDYSPFLVRLYGRSFNSSAYRYSGQGQEHDDEIKGEGNSLNFTYRMHDSRLGRFFAVDPIGYKYSSLSPYVFSANILIDAKELDGLQPGFLEYTIYNKEGEAVESASGAAISSPSKKVKLDDYPDGSYVMMHVNADGEIINQVVVKQVEFVGYRDPAEQLVADKYPSLSPKAVKEQTKRIKRAELMVKNYFYNNSKRPNWLERNFCSTCLDGKSDPANSGGSLGGTKGFHERGIPLIAGTVGVIVSGGILAFGGLTTVGVVEQTISLGFSIDDLSGGLDSEGRTISGNILSGNALEAYNYIKTGFDIYSGFKSINKGVPSPSGVNGKPLDFVDYLNSVSGAGDKLKEIYLTDEENKD